MRNLPHQTLSPTTHFPVPFCACLRRKRPNSSSEDRQQWCSDTHWPGVGAVLRTVPPDSRSGRCAMQKGEFNARLHLHVPCTYTSRVHRMGPKHPSMHAASTSVTSEIARARPLITSMCIVRTHVTITRKYGLFRRVLRLQNDVRR
jgi:hypothetical protein